MAGSSLGSMEPIPLDRFEELVDDALDDVPEELWERFDNVAVIVEEEHEEDPTILGIYEGVPLTERFEYAGALPDVIRIFRLPLCAMAVDEDDLVEEVYVTVVHELAHHMGIDDERLHDLGWA